MNGKMKICSVILNYNDAETTEQLVRLIHEYDVPEEIVVVDNASTDDSWDQLKGLEDEKVHVIRSEKNGGYGAGNNLGVRYAVEHCQATHVLIMNPDVTIAEETIIRMLKLFEKHPDIGVMSARMYDVTYGEMTGGWPLRGYLRQLLAMGPVSRRLFAPFLEYSKSYFEEKKAVAVDVVHGSLLMIDAERFLEAGGYDEGIFLYQEEDVLGWKMRTMGLRTVLLLDRSYDHAHSVSISKSFSGQIERQRLREQSVLYYMKNYLHIGRVQEWFAKVWFWGIRMEIRTAQIFSQKEK
ncbi:glycosyltransferase family 2 protein [Brotaphodocola sp.]|uniref:glycosyltransferase family 2 protein n=1 Tax=Brotaphodocola sp. TaxID=3073577 RepID=UPI003D7C6E37